MKDRRLCKINIRNFFLNVDVAPFYPKGDSSLVLEPIIDKAESDELMDINPKNIDILIQLNEYEMLREIEESERVEEINNETKEQEICEIKIRDLVLYVDVTLFYPNEDYNLVLAPTEAMSQLDELISFYLGNVKLYSQHNEYKEMLRGIKENERVKEINDDKKKQEMCKIYIRHFLSNLDLEPFYPKYDSCLVLAPIAVMAELKELEESREMEEFQDSVLKDTIDDTMIEIRNYMKVRKYLT